MSLLMLPMENGSAKNVEELILIMSELVHAEIQKLKMKKSVLTIQAVRGFAKIAEQK